METKSESEIQKASGEEKDIASSDELKLVSILSIEEKLTLAPNVEGIRRLLKSNKIKIDNKAIEEFEKYLSNLEELELSFNQDKLAKTSEKDFIKKLEQSEYFRLAKDMINNLGFSAAYVVEIHFEKDGTLSKGAKFTIRHTGPQRRHITPIGLIERIIKHSLHEGYKAERIIKTLISKVELFKPNMSKEANQYIQSVFDYFKHPENQSAEGITMLVKIVAHFYHQNLYLIMDDEYVAIPYRTNNCYLVPTLEFGGHIRLHQNEGSFIGILIKILDSFEQWIFKNGNLDKTRLAQLTYTIFAMFDFLPLPNNAVNLTYDPKEEVNRYVGENVTRLYKIVANHLLFIFEAYPVIEIFHGKDVFDKFVQYVAEGVSEESLCEVFAVPSLQGLVKKLGKNKKEKVKIDINYVKKYLLNQTDRCGFAKQYNEILENFIKALKENVLVLLISHSEIYAQFAVSLAEISPIKPESELHDNIDTYAIEILHRNYLDNNAMDHDFNKLVDYKSELNIDLSTFNEAFKKHFSKLLDDTYTQYQGLNVSEKIKQALVDMTTDEDKFKTISKLINKAITDAYHVTRKSFSSIKEEKSRFKELYLIRKQLKLSKEKDVSQSHESDSSFSLYEGTPASTPHFKQEEQLTGQSIKSIGAFSESEIIPALSLEFSEEGDTTPSSYASSEEEATQFSEEDESEKHSYEKK